MKPQSMQTTDKEAKCKGKKVHSECGKILAARPSPQFEIQMLPKRPSMRRICKVHNPVCEGSSRRAPRVLQGGDDSHEASGGKGPATSIAHSWCGFQGADGVASQDRAKAGRYSVPRNPITRKVAREGSSAKKALGACGANGWAD
jgi:hypothetical protein